MRCNPPPTPQFRLELSCRSPTHPHPHSHLASMLKSCVCAHCQSATESTVQTTLPLWRNKRGVTCAARTSARQSSGDEQVRTGHAISNADRVAATRPRPVTLPPCMTSEYLDAWRHNEIRRKKEKKGRKRKEKGGCLLPGERRRSIRRGCRRDSTRQGTWTEIGGTCT